MWYIILGFVILIYLLINLVLPEVFSGFINTYVATPLLWMLLTIATLLMVKQEKLNIWWFKKIRKWNIGETPFHAAVLIGGFQVSLLVIVGLFIGFGKSPYSFTPSAVLINFIYVCSMLFGVELSRAYLIKKNTGFRRNNVFTLLMVSLLFVFIKIPLMRFSVLSFSNPLEATRFIGENILPFVAMSLFASYLAYWGGASAAIGYMGVLQMFEWFSPVLPDLPWTLNALVSTVAPATGFLIIQSSIQTTQKTSVLRRLGLQKKDPMLSWTGVVIVSVVILFFSLGFFGVQPTVVYSGSMRPTMDVGDIAIVSKVPVENIKQGDIIQFKKGDLTVIHRVFEVYSQGNTKLFTTKGDANSDPDVEPVVPEQIIGKTVFILPKIGWIPIVVKEMLKGFVNPT